MEELKRKVNEAMQEKFVGNFEFTESELDDLFSLCKKVLKSYEIGAISTISPERDTWFFVAMVNAIKRWNSEEESFWDWIAGELLDLEHCPQKSYLYLTGLIKKLGRNKQILFLDNAPKKYYATILVHAFAPQKSILSFFELCWEIYCNDLGQNYIENDDIYGIIANELRKKFDLESGEEDVELGSQVYSFRAGVKRLAVDATEVMEILIKDTICLIHKVFNGELLETSKYYNKIIKEWWLEKESKFGYRALHRERKERVVSDYSAIKPKYILEENNVKVMLPPIRLKNNFNFCPIIEVYTGEECLISQEMYTFGSGLIMTTKPLALNIEAENIKKLRIEIVHCGDKIYSSKNTLMRDFILFKGSKEIYAQECAPGNYSLFIDDNEFDSFFQLPNNIKKQYANYYIFNATEGEVLKSEKRFILFVSERQNRELWLSVEKKNSITYRHEGADYDVIDGDLKIAVLKDFEISDFGVHYEDSNYKLSDFSNYIEGEIRYLNITELLSVCEPQKLAVFKYSNNQIVCSASVVKFHNIQIEFDKKLYYGQDNCGKVRFKTERFDETTTFNINQEEISISVPDGELLFQAPVLKWKIDNGEWHTKELAEGIWYKDITNSAILTIEAPTRMGYVVGVSAQYLYRMEEDYNKFKLGQTIYASFSGCREAIVYISIENKGVLPLTTIYMQEQFKNGYDPIAFIKPNKILWDPTNIYVGDKEDSFILQLKRNNETVQEIPVNFNRKEILLEGLEEGEYSLKVLLKARSFLTKAKLLFEKDIFIGDENILRFKKRRLLISKWLKSKRMLCTYFVNNIVFVKEIGDNIFYTASVSTAPKGTLIVLNDIDRGFGKFSRNHPMLLRLRKGKKCWFVPASERLNDDEYFMGIVEQYIPNEEEIVIEYKTMNLKEK